MPLLCVRSPCAAQRSESLSKPFLNGVLFLIYYFKKHFKSCFFILKALQDILQHFELVNWRICGFVFLMSRTGYKLHFWVVHGAEVKC